MGCGRARSADEVGKGRERMFVKRERSKWEVEVCTTVILDSSYADTTNATCAKRQDFVRVSVLIAAYLCTEFSLLNSCSFYQEGCSWYGHMLFRFEPVSHSLILAKYATTGNGH